MKKLKSTFIVWTAIYPAITLIQYVFGEILAKLPLAFRTLVLTGVLVPLMVYGLIPFWTKTFNSFGQTSSKGKNNKRYVS